MESIHSIIINIVITGILYILLNNINLSKIYIFSFIRGQDITYRNKRINYYLPLIIKNL